MTNLIFIPARSGSKRIKNKNLKEFCGFPLIYWTIRSALKCNIKNTFIMVSTDSELIADEATSLGASVPFLRSTENSQDNSNVVDAVLEALQHQSLNELEVENIILLQPTSPLRLPRDIEKAFLEFNKEKLDSIISVCECSHPPYWSNTLPSDLSMIDFLNYEKKEKDKRIYYRLNGSIYIIKKQVLQNSRNFFTPKNSKAFIMPKERSIDIDTCFDFEMAELLMNKILSNGIG